MKKNNTTSTLGRVSRFFGYAAAGATLAFVGMFLGFVVGTINDFTDYMLNDVIDKSAPVFSTLIGAMGLPMAAFCLKTVRNNFVPFSLGVASWNAYLIWDL